MAVGDKVRFVDYNSIRSKVLKVLGNSTSGAEPDYGYGQTTQSSEVDVTNKITINEWGLLRYDIINAYTHQNGEAPTLPLTVAGETVRYSTDDAPVTVWDTVADGLITNRFVQPPASQRITVNKDSVENFVDFVASVTCEVTVSFTTATAARHFFNAGGEIQFSSSFESILSTDQSLNWESLLLGAGTKSFGGNVPGTGLSPDNGQNFYRCRSAFSGTTAFSSTTGSGKYTSNAWNLYAYTPGVDNDEGTASSITFVLEYKDVYTNPPNVPENPPPGDRVQGDLTVNVTTLEPFGVLQPPGLGNFTVESPTVSIGSFTTS